MTYYLGIDAGGSHCRARLVRSDGAVIGSGQGGPVALRFRHGAQLAYVVLQLAEQAVAILAAERLEHIDAQCLLLE